MALISFLISSQNLRNSFRPLSVSVLSLLPVNEDGGGGVLLLLYCY